MECRDQAVVDGLAALSRQLASLRAVASLSNVAMMSWLRILCLVCELMARAFGLPDRDLGEYMRSCVNGCAVCRSARWPSAAVLQAPRVPSIE